MSNEQEIIEMVASEVRNQLRDAEGGHDWFHIERVWANARQINAVEKANKLIVELGALLHDIADSKFHGGDETVGPRKAREILSQHNLTSDVVEHVINIIEHISFKGGNHEQRFTSHELNVVQDADRLDALGAIGIARTFNYGGFKGRAIYNPEIEPNPNMTKDQYKNSTAPTINHFYEKLLLLKGRMNTTAGKKIAQGRHDHMQNFLDQFFDEMKGEK